MSSLKENIFPIEEEDYDMKMRLNGGKNLIFGTMTQNESNLIA